MSDIKDNNKIELWPETVDGTMLFNELTKTFKQYLALQPYQAETLALWSIFSHCFDASNIAPKLLIHSPEKRCGKSTLLEVLSELVWQPLLASNITSAVIFRIIESQGCTLMIDEADTFIKNNAEMTGIINSGHRKKTAIVWRCNGDDHTPKSFSSWAPTVIAMIGEPQDTIVDRSIKITMRRKRTDEEIARFIHHKAEAKLKELAQKSARWCKDHFDDLCSADPQIPAGLHDRASDNWRPLFAIADLIDPECSELSRVAAIELSQQKEEDNTASVSTLLLTHIQEILETETEDKIRTKDLMIALLGLEDGPWLDWNHGRGISFHQVARFLKPFGISPKQLRFKHGTARGYEQSQFKDAFARYLSGTTEQVEQSQNSVDLEELMNLPYQPIPDNVPTESMEQVTETQ